MSTESDDAAWARTHRACFQVLPLVEMRGNAKMQVGFILANALAFSMPLVCSMPARASAISATASVTISSCTPRIAGVTST